MSAPEGGPSPRRLALLVLSPIALAVAFVIGALALAAGNGGEEPAGAGPLDLSSVAVEIAGHYHAAQDLGDTYEQVPCYCGCEEFLDHRNLYDCFVRADGAGWDAHAAGCGICIAESTAVRELTDAGQGPGEIARAIVERFGTTPITAPPT